MTDYNPMLKTMTNVQINDHTVRLVKVAYPDKPEMDKRKWRAYCTEYFGDNVPTGKRVAAEDGSFYVAAAKALDAYGNQGVDTVDS